MTDAKIFAYLSEAESRRISVFRLAPESGELTKVQQVEVSGNVMPMAVTPDRRFLYAAVRSVPYEIVSFALDGSDGRLTLLGSVPAPDSTVYLSVDRTGRHLLGACNPPGPGRKTGIVTVYPIGPYGIAQPVPSMVRTPPKLHAILPDPANRFIVTPSCDGDLIVRYAFDAVTGEVNSDGLSPVIVRPQSGPRHIRFHPSGRFVYLVNEYDGSVVAYRYRAQDGALLELQTVSALPPGFAEEKKRAADLHFTPDGRWLYASVRNSATLAAFAVDERTGLLTAAGHFPTTKEPRGFAIDPLGRYLVSAGFVSGTLATFRIDGTSGALVKLAELEVGGGPNWIEFVRLA